MARVTTPKARLYLAGCVVITLAFFGNFRIIGWIIGMIVGFVFLTWPGLRRWLRRLASQGGPG